MNEIIPIKSSNHSYLAVPVPKNSKRHELKVSNEIFQCFLSYRSEEESLVYTPYRVQVNAEIIGLASSISDSLKTLLIRNNILLKDWMDVNTEPSKGHDELLIIELPEE